MMSQDHDIYSLFFLILHKKQKYPSTYWSIQEVNKLVVAEETFLGHGHSVVLTHLHEELAHTLPTNTHRKEHLQTVHGNSMQFYCSTPYNYTLPTNTH